MGYMAPGVPAGCMRPEGFCCSGSAPRPAASRSISGCPRRIRWPCPASALLSGILTKAGVFGIVVVSCVMFGTDGNWGLLVAVLGFITMFLGALLALFSVNLKRTLACSSVSQIGFILTGIGMCCLLKSAGQGNGLAVRGTFLHMVNHSMFKLVLFLCAGVVFMNLHQLDLNT